VRGIVACSRESVDGRMRSSPVDDEGGEVGGVGVFDAAL